MCCQVEISATTLSLVHRILPTVVRRCVCGLDVTVEARRLVKPRF